MKKWIASVGITLVALDSFASAKMPTTAPASVLDAIRTQAWDTIPQRMMIQYASAGKAIEPDQAKLGDWIKEYRAKQDRFIQGRQKAFDTAVRDTQILRDGGYTDLAMDGLADGYMLSADKAVFIKQPWVQSLRNDALASADKASQAGEWLKARRIYSNLSTIEPTDSKWTHQMENQVRRIRVLTRYAPESFAGVLKNEIAYRKAARAYLSATTQPSTQPSTQQADRSNETEEQIAANLKSEWQQELKGVEMDMLREALQDARLNYYKDINYGQLLAGGLNALKIFATTPGLDRTFTDLGDKAKQQHFVQVIDEQIKQVGARGADRDMLAGVLNVLSAANLQTVNLPDQVLVAEFADGAFATLDPFSTMIWPSEMDEFRTSTQGEFSGVGVQIQDLDGQIKIITPIEDSPALKAGIRAGDIITQINGKSAKGITTLQAKRQITGPTGTQVTLTVRSPDERVVDYTLTRKTIKVASIKGWIHEAGGGWNYTIDPQNSIAYLRLTNFTKESSNELNRAIEQVKANGAKAVVLDLRSNPGGLLTAATEVADKFLENGKIVSTQSLRDRGPESRVDASDTADDVHLPMVVLVNQYSASASEIGSGALRDQKRATIIGERTYGKGSVQMLFPVDKQSAFLKLTTSHYYLPNGKCIHREENAAEWGVDPDLVVQLTPEQMRKIIDAREELDILRDTKRGSEAQAKTESELLDSDLQLSAALFVLRLQLAAS